LFLAHQIQIIMADGILLLGSDLGFGINAFVGGLVGLHMLALVCCR
jgi:hypothetical protein